ncbi:MAG: NAD(P)H-dependent oxidoreductase [Rhodoplanes sp.]|uniref:NAD(P)H-dependent oxidoreductase n=1 Tax=Rhodoplanes sp. TaxID=1968906 RepID=UPI001835C1F3|nr:NAD(P)H-dependent oxidoreductase [Rhodoplanes sp.]NVO13413.1 NAD(P)H-dependent oxidoreductase [Rhodoplanes sp.]
MKAHIVYAHPEPTSFTAALKDTAAATLSARGWTIAVSDLYAERFDPVAGRHDFTTVADPARFHYQSEQAYAHANGGFAPDLVREQQRLAGSDLLVLVFPIWWGAPPAILKGWFDRVLAAGFAYVDGRRFDTGFFREARGIACVTTGGTAARFSADGVYGEIGTVLWPVDRCVLQYLGLETLDPFVAYAAPRVDAAARAGYLAAWRDRLESIAGQASADAEARGTSMASIRAISSGGTGAPNR